MIVLCKCGGRRTAMPWKSTIEIKVSSCFACTPGRVPLNKPIQRPKKPSVQDLVRKHKFATTA